MVFDDQYAQERPFEDHVHLFTRAKVLSLCQSTPHCEGCVLTRLPSPLIVSHVPR